MEGEMDGYERTSSTKRPHKINFSIDSLLDKKLADPRSLAGNASLDSTTRESKCIIPKVQFSTPDQVSMNCRPGSFISALSPLVPRWPFVHGPAPPFNLAPIWAMAAQAAATATMGSAFSQMAGPGISMAGVSEVRRSTSVNKAPAVKKYKCDVCSKAFSRSNTLVTHKRIHSGEKPFACEHCGRAFRQPGNLTRHRLTHTTVKPYVCTQCGKAFNRASNLHTHMRTHTDYRPYVCPFCAKAFHQKMDMKIHSYTHTGEKPFRCVTCQKGFNLSSTLMAHRRTSHNQQSTSKCEHCGKDFSQRSSLKNHILASHPCVNV